MLCYYIRMGERKYVEVCATQLTEPRTHCATFADHAFPTCALRKWNQLLQHNANTITAFKRLLKCHLFHLAYGQLFISLTFYHL